MSAKVGSLNVDLGINTANFSAGLNRAQIATRNASRQMQGNFAQMRTNAVGAFTSINRAAAGMGVAISATMFIEFARQSFNMAASLSETAQSIGVTVEQLQVLRRAAIENGASIETMERSMAILNRTLGNARNGSASAQAAFRAIGITREQLASFRNAGDALPAVMEGLRNVGTAAQQAARGQALFGRGVAQLLPFLTQGREGYNRITEAARAAGLITAEQARRADEASEKLALLAETLRVNLASGLLDALPHVMRLVSGLAAIASGAANAISMINRLTGLPGLSGNSFGSRLGRHVLTWGPLAPFTLPLMESAAEGNASLAGGGVGAGGAQGLGLILPAPPVDVPRTGGGGGGGDAAEREREAALRAERQHQAELMRFRIADLRERESQAVDMVERRNLRNQIMDIERAEYAAQQALEVQLGELTAARAQERMAAYQRNDLWRRETERLEGLSEVTRERQEVADRVFDIESGRLRDEAAMAGTASERREVEGRLLALTYAHERQKLEAIRDDERAPISARAMARRDLDLLPRRQARSEALMRRDTAGPLEEYMRGLPATAAQAREALERVAVDGLGGLTDALTNVVMGTESASRAFARMATSILADLVRIRIQMELKNLLGGLFGGGGASAGVGSAGGALAAAMRGIGARAAGGPVLPGRTYLVGEKGPELVRMGGHGVVIPNHEMGRAAGGSVRVEIDLKSDMLTARMVKVSGAVVAVNEPRLTGKAVDATIGKLKRPALA